jgi:glycosyltransferase involved in cell wall biosynthesis
MKKDSKKIKLFFLGGSNSRKNLLLALKIFSNLRKTVSQEISLTIAGVVTDEMYQELIQADKNISYLGYIDEKKKIELLESSHFLLYPSFYEGFGFPVLEAQRCGAVPIVTSGSGLNEVGGESIVEYDPTAEGKSFKKIKELIEDRKKYSQMKKIGLKNSQRFSWRQCARETRSILLKFI